MWIDIRRQRFCSADNFFILENHISVLVFYRVYSVIVVTIVREKISVGLELNCEIAQH